MGDQTVKVEFTLPANRTIRNVSVDGAPRPFPHLAEGLVLPYRFSSGPNKNNIVQDPIDHSVEYTPEAARLAIKRAKKWIKNYKKGSTPPTHIGLALKLWVQTDEQGALTEMAKIKEINDA